MSAIVPAAQTLSDAAVLLDGRTVLRPGTPLFQQLYVPRPHIEQKLLREAQRAHGSSRPFLWFFSGHTGAGKSTELGRISQDPALNQAYIPRMIDLRAEFDIYNLEYTDLILAMAKHGAAIAEEYHAPVPTELREAIDRFERETVREEERVTRTEGQAGLKLPFFTLGEEIRSGGTRREVIRRHIRGDVRRLLHIIDMLARSIREETGLGLLCIFDGLDHLDAERCLPLLADHFSILTETAVSKLFVVPIALLGTPLLTKMQRNYSTVPNIKVFEQPGSSELDGEGYLFYRQVIERYIALDVFDDDVLPSLFRLSAGIVRDMIDFTSEACGYAADAGASRVALAHAQRVWDAVRRNFRMSLKVADYPVLQTIDANPYIKGFDGAPKLLDSKAVVFYPNGEGWYAVHPAVKGML